MSAQPLVVAGAGLVSSVGLNAPAACAAIRAGLTNPIETRFMSLGGEWITAHAVPLDRPLAGREKLASMAAMVIDECLRDVPAPERAQIPLLLCVAERSRAGRIGGLDDKLFIEIRELADTPFSPQSLIVSQGRVGAVSALMQARKLLYQDDAAAVLIVGVDSLLNGPTLSALDKQARLLVTGNSNGFLPGEGAAGILVKRADRSTGLHIEGLGFGMETAHIDATEPLRAEGLSLAIKGALADAGKQMHDMDLRITDLSGEQYYFKEAALALSRTLRQRKGELDIWHPAECIGEAGSMIGPAMLAVAEAACSKGYADGPSILIHAANDTGERAAIVARYEVY